MPKKEDLMRLKILICVVVCLFLTIEIQGEEKEFGFTGDFKQITLKKFPYSQLPDFPEKDFYIEGKTVRALMIGIKEFSKPNNPKYESFEFYSDHWPEYDEWWVGFIVVNYGDNEVPCTITLKIKGPKQSVITREVTMQPNEATIFSAKIELAEKAGLYTLLGILTGGAKDRVKTKSYIYAVWD